MSETARVGIVTSTPTAQNRRRGRADLEATQRRVEQYPRERPGRQEAWTKVAADERGQDRLVVAGG